MNVGILWIGSLIGTIGTLILWLKPWNILWGVLIGGFGLGLLYLNGWMNETENEQE